MVKVMDQWADLNQIIRKISLLEVLKADGNKIEFYEIHDGTRRHLENRKSALISKLINPPLWKFVDYCLATNFMQKYHQTFSLCLYNVYKQQGY